ncbi:RNA polymerase sigma factor [Hespellia stercorisuis]|uniref:RNA polymerase sigma-70 factor, ECF subfamily n=1 Tax=Hespellia stercorisuis DSM 15480 TaxID=1121950 RepID=A0A1M6QB61_9FIRM|nr:RNA polymerase sigma factor [Hespellia stercorisuis]SHK17333.1 RNA polymerase sigma-70 factor, ECF subfamily [Hespellia stercorisuis DSM 15480]
MTDRELMRKVHGGDREALGAVIDRYYADIYRFCLYMIREENDAYDLTQEVFLKFIKYSISYQNNNLKGYLLTIARNVCLSYFRNKKVLLQLCELKGAEDISGVRDESHDVMVSIWLKEMLGKLSEEIREVIILRIYEELKFKEIAKIMGSNISTTKSRFRLGVKYMKKMMEDSGYGNS